MSFSSFDCICIGQNLQRYRDFRPYRMHRLNAACTPTEVAVSIEICVSVFRQSRVLGTLVIPAKTAELQQALALGSNGAVVCRLAANAGSVMLTANG